MPLYHANNVQGIGTYGPAECGLFTTNDPRNQDVVRYQKAYVAKVAAELNRFDNVIFDISDEPLLQGNPDGGITIMKDGPVVPWLHEMRDAFLGAVAKLPKKHVLGQTVQSLSPDLSLEPWCQWLPTEYVKAARNALEKNYGARKPIVDVESDYYGVGLVKPYVAEDVRLEGWWFLLGGGGGIINLNSEYHRGQPSGGPDTRERILPQRRVLKTFMESLDLRTIARFDGVRNVPSGVVVSALATPGRQYAAYMFHGGDDKEWGAHFTGAPGHYRDQVTLSAVPAGHYRLEWIDPTTGHVEKSDVVNVSGGDLVLTTPSYTLDIAMRMTRTNARGR